MSNVNLDVLNGVWSVANADDGEILSDPDHALVTGGTVLIDGTAGTAAAHWKARTRAQDDLSIRMAGRVERIAGETYRIVFSNGIEAEFVRSEDGRLHRSAYTGTTRERAMVLVPTSGRISAPDVRGTLLPPIFFNTMPKSGSIFILRCLSRGLGIDETKIAVSLFPEDLVIRERLDTLALGNLIAQQHVPASDINLRFLDARLDRMALHVRDPRQATLSWLHHLDNFHAHRDIVPACAAGLEAVSPALPGDYFDRDLPAKLDHLMDTHYPQLVAWVQGWAQAAETGRGPEILITSFEEFVADNRACLEKLLDHFAIPPDCFDFSRLPAREAQTHFRKGETDEWVSVFSQAQKAAASERMPAALAKRFGWGMG